MEVLASPPGLSLPVEGREVRFAVGAPGGLTSNLWTVMVARRGDIYIFCRDNFQDVKASLHQSGHWRFGLTADALERRPDLVEDGQDRAWHKWPRPDGIGDRRVLAFRLLVPHYGAYVKPAMRGDWKNPIVFVPQPDRTDLMTAVSVLWVPNKQDVDLAGTEGAVLATLDVDPLLEVFVVATEHPDTTGADLQVIREHIQRDPRLRDVLLHHPDAVLLGSGVGSDSVANLIPYPLGRLLE